MRQSSLIRQASLSTAGLLVQGLGRFAYTTVAARAFGPSRFGTLNTLLSLAIIASLLWPTAAGNAAGSVLARDLAAGRPVAPTLRALWKSFGWSVAAITVGFGVGATIALRLDVVQAALFAALVLTWSAYIYVRGTRMGLGQVEGAALWDLLGTLLTLGVVGGVVAGHLPDLALAPLSVGYAAFAVAGLVGARRAIGRGTAGEEAASLGHAQSGLNGTIAWNSVTLLASNGLIQFTMVFAYAASAPAEAGQFAAAFAVATPASMLAQALSQVLIPRMSHWLHEDAGASVVRIRHTLAGTAGLLALAFSAVAVAAPLIVRVAYGSAYGAAAHHVVALLGGVLLFSVMIIASGVLLVTGRARSSALLTVLGAVAGVVAMLITRNGLGGPGAAATGLALGTGVAAIAQVALAWQRAPVVAAAAHPGLVEPVAGAPLPDTAHD